MKRLQTLKELREVIKDKRPLWERGPKRLKLLDSLDWAIKDLESKEEKECEHEFGNMVYCSLPEQCRCIKCGGFFPLNNPFPQPPQKIANIQEIKYLPTDAGVLTKKLAEIEIIEKLNEHTKALNYLLDNK